jgi:CO/xanthine dehydrogenase Mo-binding subunit
MAIHTCPHCGKGFMTADLIALPPPTRARKRPDKETLVARRRAKVKTGEHVTIGAIALTLKRTPRDCRAALRALHIAKPEHGWSWPPSEAKVVEAKLSKKFGLRPAKQTKKPIEEPISSPPADIIRLDAAE